MDASDKQLLEEFLAGNSGAAFRELTERHLPLVHSTARRVTGNGEAARDVAQKVFLKLAVRASRIPRSLPLTAWLHRETHSAAVDQVRAETRRQRREKIAATLAAMNEDTGLWNDLAPVIDGAVDSLPPKDRCVVLLRFYEDKSHPEIARQLGIAEDAARMRTKRALERLRGILRRRGITTTAAALAATLPAHAVTAPPAALATTISAAAVAGTSAAATNTTTLTTLLAMTKSHLAAIGAVVVALPIIGLQHARNTKLENEAESLRAVAAGRAASVRDSGPEEDSRPARSSRAGARKGAAAAVPADLMNILAQADPMSRIRSLLGYVDDLSTGDIPKAIEEVRRSAPEWDPEARMLIHMLLTRWAREDPDAAFASLGDLDFKRHGMDASSILSSLAAMDPKRAAEWLNDPGNALVHFPLMGHILAGTVAKEWVRQDSGAALAWAEGLPDNQRAGAYSGVLGSLAASDPARASALAMELDPGEARNHAVGEIAKAWARNEPAKAMAWAQSLEGGEQQRATREALGSWAQTTPAGAAGYLDGLPDRDAADPLLADVAGSWAARDPAQAAAWVAGQAEGDGKNQAMGQVMWNWTTRDPAAAADWMGKQPPGPARDAGIGGLAKAAFEFDPGGALSWATDISNDEFRGAAVDIGLREWVKRDAEAAGRWAGENGIDLPDQAGEAGK